MDIYHFDVVTGEYKSSSQARQDPLDPSNFLIPGNATDISPPVQNTGEVARYSNGAWEIVADNRGQIYYLSDGSKHEITALGEVPPPGSLTTPPPVVPKSDDVNIERDRRVAAGFTFQGNTYQSDPASVANISGAVQLATLAKIAGGGLTGDLLWHGGTTAFSWIDANNINVDMDADTVIAFGQSMAAHKYAHVLFARNLKNMSPIPADYTADQYWQLP